LHTLAYALPRSSLTDINRLARLGASVPTILVIDDDPLVRSAVGEALQRRQFGVFLAQDGETGLNVFNISQFDAVVIDIFMPGMDGLATIRKLRGISQEIPIIAISGHPVTLPAIGRPDFLGMAVKLGASRALQKPFSPNELVDVIRDSLISTRDGAGGRTVRPLPRGNDLRCTAS
jgi:DNA-binding response OmpR family regulator